MNKSWLDSLRHSLEGNFSGDSLYQIISQSIRDAVSCGELAAGQKVPTNRELSAFLQVDRSTVARAYLELGKEGILKSQVGRGSFISGSGFSGSGDARDAAGEAALFRFSRFIQGLGNSQLNLPVLASGEYISFAGGIPAADSYPAQEFEHILLDLIKAGHGASMFDHAPSNGEPALRKAIGEHLRKRGVVFEDDELLILSGSQQGIDLVASVFVDPGDYVVLEEPSYFWAISNFKARQAKLLPCPLDEDGLDLQVLENHLKARRPKFIYSMPTNHNPTGISLSVARRKAFLELAAKYQCPIFEDDFSGDLVYQAEPLPPLKSFPLAKELVIHQGTFSKALCPGIRLGWLIAPPAVLSKLTFAKQARDLFTSSMAQVVLTEYLNKGLYHEHLAHINREYAAKRDAMLDALALYFKDMPQVRWTRPRGGLFLWLSMTGSPGASSRDLLDFAKREGVVFNPGDLCSVDGKQLESLRLCFIQNDRQKIQEGIRRLARAVELYFAHLQDLQGKKCLSSDTKNHVVI
jgi:DNA-binding transcriptional MocR family regulator